MDKPIRNIYGGIYLVIDPAQGDDMVLPVLQQAIAGGVDVVQIWNHWLPGQAKIPLIEEICAVAHEQSIPVLINEDWQLLQHTALDGVHFDGECDITAIRQLLDRPFLAGVTCGNDLQPVHWAIDHGMDYISFCSMFPSASATACNLVSVATVQQARQLTGMPIFLAGGITPGNIPELAATQMDGIAVIGGIMKAGNPKQSAQDYKQALFQVKH